MSDKPQEKFDDQSEENQENEAATEEKPEVSMKNQLLGLVLLLLVFGVLYLVMQGMPKLTGWIDSKRVEIVGGAEKKIEEGTETAELEPELSEEPAAEVAEKKMPARSGYAEQIVEQLADSGKVEVRHLAISDDETKMVAALRMEREGEKAKLFEIFFERDEFGSYISTGDAPVDTELILWKD